MKLLSRHLTKFGSILLFIYILITGGMTSCVSPKSIVYFQGDTLRNSSSTILQNYVPTIQKNDMLSIIVGSLNAEANEVFNAPNRYASATASYGSSASAAIQPFGYLVDSDGNIELPLVGKVKLEGLQTKVAADTLRARLLMYLKEPSVTIRNINFKVSVLGEVRSPAVYNIPDERITLPEVLSLAGDLTIYGRRENVLIIREENGKRLYTRIDLTSRDIFNSPYYYLHKNDVIYVEPSKVRMNATDRTLQLAPLFVSVIAAASLLFYRVSR
ncbi:polysaccharide biosynthesis/export family protein [Dyadobacter sp. CY323]|uniref:polysaccharide biosynthesis/export family protein n=1 Tax=Dyadobacter sp. CY323 TaxID=2907302 RepID=UPI001F1F49E9|nr:polysaccharide biosynthesis/export family protein [Dyadobacter sp. CY323]MCE6992763.1 polysaccharide biosynthesis/export family protein [Dyadobacter sp. CY323]